MDGLHLVEVFRIWSMWWIFITAHGTEKAQCCAKVTYLSKCRMSDLALCLASDFRKHPLELVSHTKSEPHVSMLTQTLQSVFLSLMAKPMDVVLII